MRHFLFQRPAPLWAGSARSRGTGRRACYGLAAGAVMAGLAAFGMPASGMPVFGLSALASLPATAPVHVTPARAPVAETVPLITGGRVMVTTAPGGQRSFILRPLGRGHGAAIWYETPGGDRFIVPAVAVPYAGRELGLSLFDVSALARDGISAAARIPVRLSFAPAVTPVAPPGVTLTSVSGHFARGYLTAASAGRFAAALLRQTSQSTVHGHLASTSRLFGGMTAMNLAAPGPLPTAQPHFPLHILQFNVSDQTGQPASNALVILVNTDDISREVTDVPVVNGVGRIAVPAGDYGAFAAFTDGATAKTPTAIRFVTLDDFKVPPTSGITTVSIRERSATSPITVTTPRPAAQDLLSALMVRLDAAGKDFISGFAEFAPLSIPSFVNAQPAPRVGQLHYVLQWGGAGPRSGAASYRYDVAFAASGIPASEHFTVRRGQLATVRQQFSADPASVRVPGSLSSGALDPFIAPFLFGDIGQFSDSEPMPGNLVQYLGTADGGQWVQSIFTPSGALLTADRRTFTAGHTYTLSWAHGPLAPGFGQHHGVPAPVADPRTFPGTCLTCAAGAALSLVLSPLGDSEPDHATEAIGPGSYHFTLFRDGTKLASGDGIVGALLHNVPLVPSSYRAVLDVSMDGQPGFSQSTQTHTDLTVKYAPGAGSALPAEDSCAGQSAKAPCRILPALTLNYRLATNESNTSSSPTQVLHLQVAHISYDGSGSHATVTSVTVSVSFDGGKSWRPARVTGVAGNYTASWANPATARGTDPAIRVTASDDAGGSITQTIINAYTIAAASPSGRPR